LKGRKVRKKSAAKTNAKRNRGLEFELLNEPFEGSEGHHVTKKTVLFIPKELHRSIRHNVFTGEGMEEINKLAFEWLDRKLIKAAFNILIK
ncbi:hypothetical protein KAT51_08135, partial [bacterium]|nr:hypothetical protein [bacterium]